MAKGLQSTNNTFRGHKLQSGSCETYVILFNVSRPLARKYIVKSPGFYFSLSLSLLLSVMHVCGNEISLADGSQKSFQLSMYSSLLMRKLELLPKLYVCAQVPGNTPKIRIQKRSLLFNRASIDFSYNTRSFVITGKLIECNIII